MNSATNPVPASSPAPRRGGFGRSLLVLLAAAALAIAAWTWFSLTWSYSDGDRGGVLQKFSRKGWVCKTYEGELAMYIVAGVAPQIWQFSVRDPKVAEQLGSFVGERVQLHYTEHVGVPTNCFGETGYFVDRVLPAPVPGAATMPAPAGAAAKP
jgi:hypothetical protein